MTALIILITGFVVIIAGIYFLIHKKFPKLFETGNVSFWVRIFIIMLFMGITMILAANVYNVNSLSAVMLLPSSIMCLIGIAAILYIAGLAKNQAKELAETEAEAKAAEQAVLLKDASYAKIVEKMEETNRLRHDRRQMFAVMQGMNEPHKSDELIAYCEEVQREMETADYERLEVKQ
jgi:LytS/YehU family sensor histidine kinase